MPRDAAGRFASALTSLPPERAALAAAIGELADRRQWIEDMQAAFERAQERTLDLVREHEAAKQAVVDAQAAAIEAAVGRAPAVSLRAARDLLTDATDALAAGRAAVERLRGELNAPVASLQWAEQSVVRAAAAVIVASPEYAELIEHGLRLRSELTDVAVALSVLRERGVLEGTNEVGKRSAGQDLLASMSAPPLSWRQDVGALPLAHAWEATLTALLTDADAPVAPAATTG